MCTLSHGKYHRCHFSAQHFGMSALPATPALHEAASRGDASAVAAILRDGADVNAEANLSYVGYSRATPLHAAARKGSLEVVEPLIGEWS